MPTTKSDRFARLRQIEQLDLKEDHVEIAQLFMADFRSTFIGFSYAGFMTTFAAPRMSRILHSTGQVTKRFEKRAVDTAIFASLLVQNGLGTPKGRDIAKAVSGMHAKYDIHEDDFIFIACDSAVFAVEMAERYGWRDVTEKERDAVGMFFGRQARAFGGRKPVPKTFTEMRAYLNECYDTQLSFEPQNYEMAKIATDWYANLAPAPLRPLLRTIFLSVVDPRVVNACGMKSPGLLGRVMARTVMKHLGRRDPVMDGSGGDPLRVLSDKVYPNGYEISDLGPKPGSVDTSLEARAREMAKPVQFP